MRIRVSGREELNGVDEEEVEDEGMEGEDDDESGQEEEGGGGAEEEGDNEEVTRRGDWMVGEEIGDDDAPDMGNGM